ncbi:FtsK/SpoIIIE domain-containing protein [Pseudonocardia eucalypti]|uniref:FtsK/SpoIIIE domain-containing protein n=1 Tax=Pseudonocardia eucalypti TaxID=648755 RepID=A0ABP9QCY1_9PSEU|nr:S-DNA-T family DNA segregation ATPase FtsK/SpoIIIE [Pseudonocardia eucalypti]
MSKGNGYKPGGRATRPTGRDMKTLAWLWRHPLVWSVPVVLVAGWARYGWLPVAYTLAGAVGVLVVWWRVHPPTFDRWVLPTLRAFKRRWWDYRGGLWGALLFECDLTRDNRLTGEVLVPRLERVRAVTPSIDVLRVRMVRGQDLRAWTDRSEALAEALCAHRVAVAKAKPGRLTVVVERENPFAVPLPAPEIPTSVEEVDLSALDIGDDEFGQPVLVSVTGTSHLFVAGATGTGKSSTIWGPLRQMGPMIRDGLVRVRVIDPKGGTETEIGKELFYRRAVTIEDALELLREAREDMKAAQQRLRGDKMRRAVLGPDSPQDLIMVDELAMLTAFASRGDRGEAIALLSEIMTQGRNTLFNVAGYVQEPSKDVVEIRELFTTRICLGVTAASHVDMALGDGARDRGALADEIPLDEEHAGIGFRVDKGSRLPRRLRLGHTTDEDITELVKRCAPLPPAGLAVVRNTGEVA